MWTRRKFLGTSCISVGTALAAIDSSGSTLSAVSDAPITGNPNSADQDSNQEVAARLRRARGRAGASETAVASAEAVLLRQLGSRASEFHLHSIPSEGGYEVYEIKATGGQVEVSGSSGVALCRGIYSYLRSACNAMITWGGRNVNLPATLPDYASQRVVCPYKFVQYLNPCTYGYTMAFWDWERWERELDWMALHGITMPLAMDGQEAIWQRVWLSMGLTQREIDDFSTGPGHLPWHRMGNINNFDGPLPQNWIEGKRVLQGKILDRMRELGMKPVAPAFAGFVPQGFKRLHPEAETFTLLWLADEFKTIPRSTRTFILHPGENALYRQIGKKFIEEYKAEYGEVEYYLADTFNELAVPVSQDHRYEDLERFGRTVYEGIQAGDPNGTWVMQGWLFVYASEFWDNASVQALLRGVPNDRMLIIDYANDLTPKLRGKYAPGQWKVQKAFFGKQWINGMAHTFGGNNNIKGNLALMASEPAAVLHSEDRGNLVGWGMCPEGIENNEVVYELMTDAGWLREPIDLTTWIPAYCTSRYGACPPAMQQAWKLLLESAYSAHIWMTKQAWQGEPSTHPEAAAVDSGATFVAAVELFLSCADKLSDNALYRNDLIELVVQAVGGQVDRMLQRAVETGGAKQQNQIQKTQAQKAEAKQSAERAIGWMRRMDALMNLRADRRLESWTQAARSWARSEDEAAYYDENARRLITTWGWPELSDYASRAWSGLTRDYYAARWSAYFEAQQTGHAFSLDLWQQTWLSSPYRASKPLQVTNLIGEAKKLLEECHNFA
ncbi:alpha-N-acetylglucosaminidase [Acidicapsa ligni]|uniref:alpha-N-acetylglucosaminidase n=1 Tax=Acidicapsa ligni TaxID=542300 RepID=UPI0021E05692|nr:alpha-N-acetylglucosaminidase [Acidicapsa ligni]